MVRNLLELSRKRRRRWVLWRAAGWLLAFFFTGGALASLFYIPQFQIRAVAVQGAKSLDSALLAAEVSSVLQGKYFRLLPKNNLIFLPRKKVAALLQKEPRIESFSMERRFPSALEIEIKEREPWGIWCQGERCFFADQTGFVFAPAPLAEGRAIFKIKDEREENFFGKHFLPRELLEKIIHLAERVAKRFEEEPWLLEIKTSQSFKLLVKSGWYLKLDDKTDFDRALENLALALRELGERREQLEYLDLRFTDKVFYK